MAVLRHELIGWTLIAIPPLLVGYAYGAYPLLLQALSRLHRPRAQPADVAAFGEWPTVSISLPVYNEALQLRDVIESLLALDYPADRRQILVISDCSNDGTDGIVAEYAHAGVELLRLPARRGKTAAEQAGAPLLRGEIVVNTDASIRIHPASL